MGRHAAGPPEGDAPRPAAPTPSATSPGPAGPAPAPPEAPAETTRAGPPAPAAPARPHRPDAAGLRPRDALLVALLVAAVTAGVLVWAGSTVWVVVLGALGAGALVPLAAWVARSVPGPGHPVQ